MYKCNFLILKNTGKILKKNDLIRIVNIVQNPSKYRFSLLILKNEISLKFV